MYYDLNIPKRELWDEQKEEFIYIPEINVRLLHSLLSVSSWEAKYHKPFIDSDKSNEELLDYIRMMVIGKKPDKNFVYYITPDKIKEITDYINDPMSATTVPKQKDKKNKKQIITNELVYCWMSELSIPYSCERWHFNRLLKLIEVCAYESQPEDKKKKKLSATDLAERRAQMQAARAKYKK